VSAQPDEQFRRALNSHVPSVVARHLIASHGGWTEEVGEVELIGGWAEIPLGVEFAALVDTSDYQVFVTSYDAVLVFVQNRTPTGFEIHVLPALHRRYPRATRCAYRVMAGRLNAPSGSS
jgi:hypothetical protein